MNVIFIQGVPQLGRYTLEDIRQHNTIDDAWTAIQGKVYNMTAYVKFHPGGVKDLMRIAGRDGTKLFSKSIINPREHFITKRNLVLTHAWVNVDFMLDACMVGFLVQSKPREDDDDDD